MKNEFQRILFENRSFSISPLFLFESCRVAQAAPELTVQLDADLDFVIS